MSAGIHDKKHSSQKSAKDKTEPKVELDYDAIHKNIQRLITEHAKDFPEFKPFVGTEKVGNFEVRTAIQNEQTLRAKILNEIAERFKDSFETIGKYFQALGNNPDRPKFSAAIKAISNLVPDLAGNLIPFLSPTQAFAGMGAASNMRRIPGQKETARALGFLSGCELIANAGSLIHLLFCAAVGGLKTLLNIANEADKFTRAIKKEEKRDKMIEAAKAVANAPGMAQAMDGALALSEFAAKASEPIVTNLKELLASQMKGEIKGDVQAQLKKALKDVSDIIKTPENGAISIGKLGDPESYCRFHSDKIQHYLKDPHGLWNMYVLERDGKVFGAYSAFTVKTPNGTHLVVESVIPPGESHPVAHKEVWEHIVKQGQSDGIKRIWHDWSWNRDGKEPPPGFRPIYGSSTLGLPVISSEALGYALTRMAVHAMGNGHPTYAEYREAILPVCAKYQSPECIESHSRVAYSNIPEFANSLLDFRPRRRHI